MRTTTRWIGRVANRAFFAKWTIISLQGDKFCSIGRNAARSDRVRAVMAGFAIQAAVSGGEAIQRIVLRHTVVAVATLRLIQPGRSIRSNFFHSAVAGNTGHAFSG